MTTTPKPAPASEPKRDICKCSPEHERNGSQIPEEALHIAAQSWCDPETSDRIMDPPLAMAFAKRLAPYLALRAENEKISKDRERVYGLLQGHGLVKAERDALRAENKRLKALEDGDVLDCAVCRHFVIRGRDCEVCRLRAQLAEKEREIAADNLDLATEKAARERAESRVKELEEVIADAGKCVTMREVHEALAAARAKEESK